MFSKCCVVFACVGVWSCSDVDVSTAEVQSDTSGVHTPLVSTIPAAPLPRGTSLHVPGGVIIGAVVSSVATATGENTLTDDTQHWIIDSFKGRHVTDSGGYSWEITGNTETMLTIDPRPYTRYTPPAGTYKISGEGLYVGPNLPTRAATDDYLGGVCASEHAATCPTGYVKGDHGFFGTADGTDNDFAAIGCTDLEQVRWIHPYRPPTCFGCGTGSNGCAHGADCPWSTITKVADYGNSGNQTDFFGFVRTSDLHFDPGQSLELDGLNDGNDTGRIMLVTNDSDMPGHSPHNITLRNDSHDNLHPGDGFLFPDGLDNWILPPGGKMFLMHDDASGPNRWRLVGWGSTHFPSLTIQRLTTEATHNATVSGCGTSPTITKGDWSGTVTGGAGAPTSCSVTFAQPFASTPTCVVSNQDVGENSYHGYSVTPTGLTLTSSNEEYPITKFDYICVGH